MKKEDKGFYASRRELLKAAGGCSMMSGVSMLSTYLSLQATNAVAADYNPTDYKAIVCLFLTGGNDSYNMLTPYDGEGSGDVLNTPSVSGDYGGYYSIRGGVDDGTINAGGLALSKAQLTQLADPVTGRSHGLHPSMSHEAGVDPTDPSYNPSDHGVARLYNDNKLNFVCNIGSLLERTDMASYDARTNLPLGLFSHADLVRHWQTGVPDSRTQLTGWGGRLADCMQQANTNPVISSNISINGVNVFQTGGTVIPYSIGTSGATVVTNYHTDYATVNRNHQDRIFSHMVESSLGRQYPGNLMSEALASQSMNSIQAAVDFNAAADAVNITTEFQNELLSNRMKMLAKVIGASSTLGHRRQIFFVTEGGWDNHNNLMTQQPLNLADVSAAMKSFYDATVELGMENNVVTFTASDFARTLTSNGQGSDHGWGGNQMVMGGAVDGGSMKGFSTTPSGPYPIFDPSQGGLSPLDTGRGRLIPTTSVDELAADLAMWFGVSNNEDLELILPNIRRFYSSSETESPLGLFT